MMNGVRIGISAALMISLLWGCEQKPATTPTPDAEASAEAPKPETTPPATAATTDKVVVTAEGVEFKPPVSKDKLPAGVHYCDMGTVHYARAERGDGKCPLCGMMLTQLPGGAAPESQPAKKEIDAAHGHDHEGHDHAH